MRHNFEIVAGIEAASTDTTQLAWTDAGAGKLRYKDGGTSGARLFAQYRGRVTETLSVLAALDYDGTDGSTIGLTEAVLAWRPVPTSTTRHRLRAGALYPPFSLENSGVAWSSPLSMSYSAINSWLAEEIRPIGVEWQVSKRIGDGGSRHELTGFGAFFYGNDPAGTLLFWRGFALHDRQSRLNARVALPTIPILNANGQVIGSRERALEPFAETDGEPGFYGGAEWRLGRRALVGLAMYDNRADPESFRGGQWGWDTRFWHASMQVELPAGFGLLGQRMRGATEWLTFVTATGQRTAQTEWVRDNFDALFLMLTRTFLTDHRVGIRWDSFGIERPGALRSDDGHAYTFSYSYQGSPRLAVHAEVLRIDSTRDLWPTVYNLPPGAVERQFRIRLQMNVASRH